MAAFALTNHNDVRQRLKDGLPGTGTSLHSCIGARIFSTDASKLLGDTQSV